MSLKPWYIYQCTIACQRVVSDIFVVIPVKRTAEDASKAEVLSAQRLECVTAQYTRDFHEHTCEQKRQIEAVAAAGIRIPP